MGIQIHSGSTTTAPLVSIEPAPPPASKSKPKKKFLRRRARDRSQQLRLSFQIVFLLMNVWLGSEFYLWVRQFEMGNSALSLARPAGVEGWLPIAGLMNLKYWLGTGEVPAIHPAAMFLLLAFLSIAFLFRKAFCSWLCPVGTLSEYLWRAGRKILRRNFQLPAWVDIPLRGLKYLLLGFFLWAVAGMSAEAIASFMRTPYGLIAEVKMLNFFRFLGITGLAVIGVLVVASMLVQNFWCRYLCPYGALLGLVSLPSPLRIRRNAQACIDCEKCAKACPAWLPVDRLGSVRSAECTGCLECVAVCPVEGALAMSLPPKLESMLQSKRKRSGIPAWTMAAGIALVFLGLVGFAKTAGHWNSRVPNAVYQKLVPHANQAQHPMP